MIHAVYKGPIRQLQGMGALIRPTDNSFEVRAQFDSMELMHPDTAAMLGYGWHTFPASDFTIEEQVKTIER